MVDIKQLVDWLGPDGAFAGLESSDITIAELRQLAAASKVVAPSKGTRIQLIRALTAAFERKIDKGIEELLSMDYESIRRYFEETHPSRRELLRILAEVDVRPPGKGAGNLFDFAAREIGDIGLYQRVAKGHQQS